MESKRILLVDDDQEFLEMLTFQLEKSSKFQIEFFCLNDGVAGSQELEVTSFDLIITDLKMPRKGGDDVLKRVRYSKLNSSTPIIVISGFPAKNQSVDYAPLTYLTKPYDTNTLINIVNECLLFGKPDYRIPTKLLQPFFSVLIEEFKKAKIKLKNYSRPFHNVHYNPDGHIHLAYYLEFEKHKNRFSISFDKSVFMKLASVITNQSYDEIEENIPLVAHDIGQFIYSKTAKLQQMVGEEFPHLIECMVLNKQQASHNLELIHSKDICLVLSTELGNCYIKALSGNSSIHESINAAV